MSLFETLPTPFFVLAPMDDVTDTIFRQVVADCARPDLFFTEFVNVDGLQSPGRPKLLKKLLFTVRETPLIAQIWGKHPDNFYKTARQLADGTFAAELGLPPGINYAGIDLNMGCPDKTVVKNGACSALINNRSLAAEIIQATKEGSSGELPISVKTRLGFSQVDMSWLEFLLQQDIAMLTVHGRTRREMSKVPVHWEVYEAIRLLRDHIAPQTKLVLNGDIVTRQQGIEVANHYGVEGIMIGRGVFQDPFVFSSQSPWLTCTKAERLALFKKHAMLFIQTWVHSERPLAPLNKFCKVYLQGFDGAKELREAFMQITSGDELLHRVTEILNQTSEEGNKVVGMAGLEPATNRL